MIRRRGRKLELSSSLCSYMKARGYRLAIALFTSINSVDSEGTVAVRDSKIILAAYDPGDKFRRVSRVSTAMEGRYATDKVFADTARGGEAYHCASFRRSRQDDDADSAWM
jgi:hypothetical protein